MERQISRQVGQVGTEFPRVPVALWLYTYNGNTQQTSPTAASKSLTSSIQTTRSGLARTAQEVCVHTLSRATSASKRYTERCMHSSTVVCHCTFAILLTVE